MKNITMTCHFGNHSFYVRLLILSFLSGLSLNAVSQEKQMTTVRTDTLILPGKGLAQHPFLYTGEWDYRKPLQNMYLVRDGKIVWNYGIPLKNEKGEMEELGDATQLSNGNIVFCRKVGASEITLDKKIIWNIVADSGCEIHSIQPIGLDRVLVMQNGNPAKLMTINTVTNKIEKQIILPTGK